MDGQSGNRGFRRAMRVGMLETPAMARPGRFLLRSAAQGARACGHEVVAGRLDGSVLMTYGLGGPDRLPVAMLHKSVGGRFVAFDAGYWRRDTADRYFRLAIDAFHPQAHVMQGEYPGPKRWESARLKMESHANAGGPIILVGNAPKAIKIGAAGWSAKKLAEIRRVFPGRKVLYRPKPRRPAEPIKADGVAEGDIDSVLRGASLVVCRHSNVAVDACRLGVPVVCDDGAASAIYPARLEDHERQPSADLRAEFLHRLAWWQWTTAEVRTGMFWNWLEARLC